MILFPAVDIKGGKCVRLKQGKAGEMTVFSDDPVQIALHWAGLGAEWLHVVDLDGAFEGEPVNFEIVKRICNRSGCPVQLGGGIRRLQTARRYFQAGVSRLIIGTMALEDKEGLAELCREFPGRIGVSLDADQGRLKSKGWVQDSGLTIDQVLPELERLGVAFLIYTDIDRDGMQSGVNLAGVKRVLENTALPVIAAGGVKTLEDIQRLFPLQKDGLAGVITGKAIYEKTLDFEQTLQWLESSKSH
ncbi:MAG: 1-(5-phosphoribosyl)-5-[(5-phosphoribosylamino)methylideneamino]imidazole-4-carboxamide isomerase [Desulfohalobiaceae bacterium]|nr:1-(5-phosphoribosyl)-5-[(5-phosphoribosylamino)methylideneamino]imidazole-4-carboxamide isomerase [Desulfohalobiaceae bacterium]